MRGHFIAQMYNIVWDITYIGKLQLQEMNISTLENENAANFFKFIFVSKTADRDFNWLGRRTTCDKHKKYVLACICLLACIYLTLICCSRALIHLSYEDSYRALFCEI